MVAAALVEGEAEALVNKALELAKTGNVAMLKMFLSPLLPRERLVQIELPHLRDADHDPVKTLAQVIRAVAEGKISPCEGAAIAGLLECYRSTLELSKVVQRIDELEVKLATIPF